MTLDTRLDEIFYLSPNGRIYCEAEIEMVFEVQYGTLRKDAEREFKDFLARMGYTEKLTPVHPTIRELLEADRKVLAITAYRNETGKTLAESRAAINAWVHELSEKGA